MSERCILVDALDRPVGNASKRDCHSWPNIARGGMLHRAFSVFLFDSEGRLLLQQRAAQKITFPDMWTNSCCSHPLDRPEERAEKPFGIGVLRAAQRKLKHELGIPSEQVRRKERMQRSLQISQLQAEVRMSDSYGRSTIVTRPALASGNLRPHAAPSTLLLT